MTKETIDTILTDRFDNCISLGWFCGTASALSAHGLRSFSSPFDWCYSNLDSVLKMIEHDFEEWMLKENLQVVEKHPKWFLDIKYGFSYNHEICCDFEQEFSEIYEKYKRRVKRFIEETKHPTCFLRAVRSEEEIAYIKKNVEYIYRVIRKGNADNEIIFLVSQNITVLNNDFLWFRLGIDRYIGKRYEMMTMFLSSKELVKYCENGILPEEKMKKNILYRKSKIQSYRDKMEFILSCAIKSDENIVSALRKSIPTLYDEGIYIWGAGQYGTLIADYLKTKGINVHAMIDNDEEKIGNLIDEIPVVSFCDISKGNTNILLAIASKNAVASVIEQKNAVGSKTKIITLEEIFDFISV